MSCLGRMLPQTIRMDGSRPPIRKKLVTNNYNPTFCRNRLYRLWIKLFYGPSTQVYRNSKRINVHQKYKKENNAQIIMEQQPQLNDHNKQEYPPMHIYIFCVTLHRVITGTGTLSLEFVLIRSTFIYRLTHTCFEGIIHVAIKNMRRRRFPANKCETILLSLYRVCGNTLSSNILPRHNPCRY